MVPCVYFFFPETAYRSLEEMDEIFHKVHGFQGAFDVVRVAKKQPHRFGKKGELLIDYENTDEALEVERRRSSVASGGHAEKATTEHLNGGATERVEDLSRKGIEK